MRNSKTLKKSLQWLDEILYISIFFAFSLLAYEMLRVCL